VKPPLDAFINAVLSFLPPWIEGEERKKGRRGGERREVR
jgi:hypothetical protein